MYSSFLNKLLFRSEKNKYLKLNSYVRYCGIVQNIYACHRNNENSKLKPKARTSNHVEDVSIDD